MAHTELPDPAQLAGLIKTLSDEELKAQIDQLGTDNVLREVFGRMPEAFIAEKARNRCGHAIRHRDRRRR